MNSTEVFGLGVGALGLWLLSAIYGPYPEILSLDSRPINFGIGLFFLFISGFLIGNQS